MYGLLSGFIDENKLTNIETCATDAHEIFPEIQKVIADLKDGETAAALEQIVGLVEKLPEMLKSCKDMDEDVAALKTWVDTFDSKDKLIQTIEKNALKNIFKLKADVTKITADWDAEKFSDVGKDAADVVQLALGPVHPAQLLKGTPADIEALLAGLVEGWLDENKLTEIQACATDAAKEAPLLEKAIKDLESGDVAGAVTELKQIVADAPTILSNCKSMDDDIAALKAWEANFNSVDKLEALVEKNIKASPVKVAKDVASIQSDFKAQKFQDVGKDAADLLTIALGPVHPAQFLFV